MDFTSKEDIDAPIADVFESLSDFDNFERSAFRRGAEVQRLGDTATPGAGLVWEAKFPFRGKSRDMRIVLSEYVPVTRIVVTGDSSGLQGVTVFDLLALSPRRTRIAVKLTLTPKTLSGRLLVQSLKLVRGKLERRFKSRVSEFARLAEDRLNDTA